jgi:hypothetical protein
MAHTGMPDAFEGEGHIHRVGDRYLKRVGAVGVDEVALDSR